MRFKDIIGQKAIKQRLIETVKNGRVSHAQLFLGKGVNGKFALAVAYAQYLNCPDKTEEDSCGVCPSCKKYHAMSHPDLFFSFPVNKKSSGKKEESDENKSEGGVSSSIKASDLISTMFYKEWLEYLNEVKYYPELQSWYKKIGMDNQQGNINVAEARRLVQDMSYKPVEADYKVLIIWQPEKMNISASNVLLKFFEEPPQNTLIFMVADEKDQLLKTIQSRFQIINIPKIDDLSLTDYIRTHAPHLDAEKLMSAVALANGDLYKAQTYVQEGAVLKDDFMQFQSWMRLCYKKGSLEGIKDFVEKIARIGRENQKHFLHYALRIFQQSLLINYGHQSIVRLTHYEAEWLEKFAQFVHINNAPEMIEKVENAINEIGRNASASILFMKLSLDMSVLLKKTT
jgi:DNA polymerase-3 subunit delta'